MEISNGKFQWKFPLTWKTSFSSVEIRRKKKFPGPQLSIENLIYWESYNRSIHPYTPFQNSGFPPEQFKKYHLIV